MNEGDRGEESSSAEDWSVPKRVNVLQDIVTRS